MNSKTIMSAKDNQSELGEITSQEDIQKEADPIEEITTKCNDELKVGIIPLAISRSSDKGNEQDQNIVEDIKIVNVLQSLEKVVPLDESIEACLKVQELVYGNKVRYEISKRKDTFTLDIFCNVLILN
ncbi:hypothetical protein GOBAR_DD05535 [Gossypium barbadense]|nr:hypothetical protein GOBAR_DD05535 [Gossypium barbadense]